MNGKERLNSIMNKQGADRLCFTALVDNNTLDTLPGKFRGMNEFDFYRHLGADVFDIHWFYPPLPERNSTITEVNYDDADKNINELRVPEGALKTIYSKGHPIKFPVSTIEEVEVYRQIIKNSEFRPHLEDDKKAFIEVEGMVQEHGIVTSFWGPSTVPHLLEFAVGVENFYYLLSDYPFEMKRLMDTIHEKELKLFETLANGPCDTVILCENTSTQYISPDVYLKYNRPHVCDFVEIVHKAGKKAVIHMCGHVKNLLTLIKDTKLDGIHALTPPKLGDTPWELALDVLGEDLIILGGIGSFPSEIPMEKVLAELDALYTKRLRRSNFIFCAGADGLSIPFERFKVLADWFEKNGKIQ